VRILGIECATAVCAAAIADDDVLLAEHSIETPRVHSEQLISLIERSFKSIQSNIGSLDGIAVSIGPGSFTGLRIGLSSAKGLAYASGKGIIAVPTLEGLAFNIIRQNLVLPGDVIVPMIDARRDELYAAVYINAAGNLEEIIPPCALSVNESLNITKTFKKVVVTGDGAEKFQKYIQKVEPEQSSRYIIPAPKLIKCTAGAIALVGARKFAGGQQSDLAKLEPLYIKEFHTTANTQNKKAAT